MNISIDSEGASDAGAAAPPQALRINAPNRTNKTNTAKRDFMTFSFTFFSALFDRRIQKRKVPPENNPLHPKFEPASVFCNQ
jgi:hypothetical protein